MSRETIGEWSPPIDLRCVAVHVTLLPNGKILYWGRRSNPKEMRMASLDEHFTIAYVLDPNTPDNVSQATTNQPTRINENDGTVFVAGGHMFDANGVNQACVYDPVSDTWTAKPLMNKGRWYPSVTALPSGSMLVVSGQYARSGGITIKSGDQAYNNTPQIWSNNAWINAPDTPQSINGVLYPRMHLDPKGRGVFVVGINAATTWLQLDSTGNVITSSKEGPMRDDQNRDQASSVMYDLGKIMYIGGGQAPTEKVYFIDLTQTDPKWTQNKASNMTFPRRQFNATVLPDGSVLATGGTKGPGFNDLGAGNTTRIPELWSPKTNSWMQMAIESEERCYHGTALLLPDGRVMSAGNGEYGDGLGPASRMDARFFSPPYLFKPVARPSIQTFPATVDYKQKFDVILNAPDSIERISWVRLGSVTHCTNMGQSLMFLQFEPKNSPTQSVKITAPDNSNEAPPGHYMLFLMNLSGKPSVAPIIQIKPLANATKKSSRMVASHVNVSIPTLNEKIINEQDRPPVALGITSACPYGVGACWGGAFDALQRMSDIEVVRPMPDAADSMAFVYLKRDILPDIDLWRNEFAKFIGQQYDLRGIEMTLSGVVTQKQLGEEKQLTLAGTSTRPDVVLAAFRQESKIEYELATRAVRRMTAEEAGAYGRLLQVVGDGATGVTVQVTGTLQKHTEKSFYLDVRVFEVDRTTAS